MNEFAQQPQRPNYSYLVASSGEKIAELIPVPMELVDKTEQFLIEQGCEHIQWRRDMRLKSE